MELLTIGEFARLARLSQKALRLYGELGLLPPARVDEWTGYRYYAPSQLERARLVAWLRRLGLPLAQIAAVLDAPPAEAAAAVTAFLRVAEADLAERQRLAQFLIVYLSEGATAMPEQGPPSGQVPPQPAPRGSQPAPFAAARPEPVRPAAPAVPLTVRYAAGSDIGRIRERNQDVGYASTQLLAVADGFGPAGERASAAAVAALRQLETLGQPETPGMLGTPPTSPGFVPADLLNALSEAVSAASESVRSVADGDPAAAGSGSTLTAMLVSGSRLALVHIGDSRAYLFRDGGLFQITNDHSVTQSMIDAGRLTPEEAVSHPQRSLLIRALGASVTAVAATRVPPEQAAAATTPDLSLLDARPGDRYLLCSDGLTAAVPVAVIRQVLAAEALSPADAVRQLITLANEAGGPDNIACALAVISQAAEPGATG